MKRLNSSDSLGAFICPSTDEHSPRNNLYSKEFQSMLDGYEEEVCFEESGHVSEKKRRLSVDQVKALEKNFEVENKLEPERKVKLAQELGLQPRQVAVWFQNRRARWKTKQLERDYGILKANYDSLKLNYDALHLDNDSLLKEIRELKSKLNEEITVTNLSIKEEKIVAKSDEAAPEQKEQPPATSSPALEIKELNYETFNNTRDGLTEVGNSDSDSSAILNEDNSPTAAISSSEVLQTNQISSPAAINCFQFQKTFHPHHYVKMEEHNFFTADEACNFFSDEQPPTLQWYCPDQWN